MTQILLPFSKNVADGFINYMSSIKNTTTLVHQPQMYKVWHTSTSCNNTKQRIHCTYTHPVSSSTNQSISGTYYIYWIKHFYDCMI